MSASVALLLADGPDAGKAGPIGLLVVIVLCVVSYFLFRSMSRHLRKLREQYPNENAPMNDAKAATAPGNGEPVGGAVVVSGAEPSEDTTGSAPPAG